MAANLDALPEDPAILKAMLAQALEKIEKLEHYVEILQRHQFGRKSETIPSGQELLSFVDGLDVVEPPPASTRAPETPKSGHGRRALPKNLPVIVIVHDLPESQKRCDECRQDLVRIGEEVSDQLEYKPASLHVIRHVRPKYACREGHSGVSIAELPESPIPKGVPGPGLLAYVATSKYADHLPLYRLQAIFARQDVEVSRSTLCDWVGRAAELLSPIVSAVKKDVLASKVVHTDDTPVPVLDPQRDQTRQARLWVYVGDRDHPQTAFDYSPNREQKHPQEFLKDFKGHLQADAYSGYDAIYAGGSVVEVGCWAHARRYFYDAQTTDAARALAAMAFIGKLYEVEAAAKELSADERQRLRQERSAPILEAFERWVDQEAKATLPKSPTGEAMTYVTLQRKALRRYLDDGNLSIDNNAAERALRGVAIGRKNWLFAGSDEGGKRAAVLYSLIASCKQCGVEPFAYLRDVIERVSRHPARAVDELMPRLWKPACAEASAGRPPPHPP